MQDALTVKGLRAEPRAKPVGRQRGAVLVTSLMMVTVLSVFSVSGLSVSLMQERMTQAVGDTHRALQAAEAALRDAESSLQALEDTRDFDSSGGLYLSGAAPEALNSATWAAGSELSLSAESVAPEQAGRYFVEEVVEWDSGDLQPLNVRHYGDAKPRGPTKVFRIVAYGSGRSLSSQRWLAAHYAKEF